MKIAIVCIATVFLTGCLSHGTRFDDLSFNGEYYSLCGRNTPFTGRAFVREVLEGDRVYYVINGGKVTDKVSIYADGDYVSVIEQLKESPSTYVEDSTVPPVLNYETDRAFYYSAIVKASGKIRWHGWAFKRVDKETRNVTYSDQATLAFLNEQVIREHKNPTENLPPGMPPPPRRRDPRQSGSWSGEP